MVGRKVLALVLTSAPYDSQYADHMCRVALAAVKKGHAVEIFLYGDGVHAQMSGQSPRNFFPVGDSILELISKGASVYSCGICSEARGYMFSHQVPDGKNGDKEGKIIEGVQVVDMTAFTGMLARADKVLSFGGG